MRRVILAAGMLAVVVICGGCGAAWRVATDIAWRIEQTDTGHEASAEYVLPDGRVVYVRIGHERPTTQPVQ